MPIPHPKPALSLTHDLLRVLSMDTCWNFGHELGKKNKNVPLMLDVILVSDANKTLQPESLCLVHGVDSLLRTIEQEQSDKSTVCFCCFSLTDRFVCCDKSNLMTATPTAGRKARSPRSFQ